MSRTWTVSCPPCGHATVIRFFDETKRNARGGGALFKAFSQREAAIPGLSVRGFAGFDASVCFEPNVGFGIGRAESAEAGDFLAALALLLAGEAAVVLVGPKRRRRLSHLVCV